MSRARTSRRRSGFTLVELLTVIGIISLLISILLPSLSRARDQAKKTSVKAQLDAMAKGLEMFQNDFNQYPDSSLGIDPIDWSVTWPATNPLPMPPANSMMTGAHWMARAMIGHDFQGIDSQGVMLKRVPNPAPAGYVPPVLDDFLSSTVPAGKYSNRKGMYLDPKVFVRDDDTIKFPSAALGTGPTIGRIIVVDGYNFPVLYYRAKTRAQLPFDIGTINPTGSSSQGVYCQADNAPWTGDTNASTYEAFDFAGAGAAHGLGKFNEGGLNVPGDYIGANISNLDMMASAEETAGKPYKGKTFVNYFHSENTHQAGNAASPVNPETFILISAGKDGLYGTDDDVNNFQSGL